MHEVSLAAGVLKLVEDTAAREGFTRLVSLRLEVGQFAGVELLALRFALQGMAPGTLLAGAAIEIEQPLGQARCLNCHQTVELQQRGDACPACASFLLQATGGMELRVLEMEVSDD